MKLPSLTQQPVKVIDATPDENYPLRILQAYRQDCDCMWAESTCGEEPTNPLLKLMNEHNRQRAETLERAIKILRQSQKGE